MTATFAALCDLARPYGIGINLEPMPWTDCRNFAQGVRIVTLAGRDNGGVLIDAIHFDRGGSSASETAALPRSRLRYMQLCDAPAARPTDVDELLRQARAERLMPGDGGLDLDGILRSVPGRHSDQPGDPDANAGADDAGSGARTPDACKDAATARVNAASRFARYEGQCLTRCEWHNRRSGCSAAR